MADKQNQSYPMLPIGAWWTLRKKFAQSIPGVVTDSYLATVLNMAEGSARNNVLPYLKTLGIIDEEGKTSERARLWRDNETHAQVCKEIREAVYPSELLHAVADPEDRAKAESWFARRTGGGRVTARRMAAIYSVLLEADVSKQPERERGERPARKGERPAEIHRAETRPAALAATEAVKRPQSDGSPQKLPQAPDVNINLEIHISADSTPEQIDQIFASMAKHIYGRS